MKALVTGGTGFIGAWIVRALLGRGVEVRVAARKDSSRERLAGLDERIEWVTADLFGDPTLDRVALCAGVDLVVHAAWYAVPGKYLEATENLTCVSGSLALLEALALAGVRRAVFVGTCFEYDFDYGWLSESRPIKPTSLYAAAKAGTRLMAERIARGNGLSFAWVRPFYQYGPFEDARRLVPYVIDTLLRGETAQVTRGLQVRDFLHVADVGAAIAAVAVSDLEGIVNIGSGAPVTVREIVATIAAILGCERQVAFGARPDNPTDPPFICADNRRLVEGAGWSARFDLRSGLEDTIASRRDRARA
jgi:nucleoside-diphosphate-sugar epimerase